MTKEQSNMKVVVIGGTGLIGSKVVTKLSERGYHAMAASPASGVNTLTGEGVAEVLKGASVVVDVSNSPSFEDAAVMEFFKTSTRNLLTYAKAAGVGHYVALSVVGSERLLELWWPGNVFSLSHVALPFAPDDPLYGYDAPRDPRHLQLGSVEVRGENGVLNVPTWMLTRQRSNPFYPYLVERIESFVRDHEPQGSP